MNDLLRRRRGMMVARKPARDPIYRISNYDMTAGIKDTGVILAQEGSPGYTIIAKFDSSLCNMTLNYLSRVGTYGKYAYIYIANEPSTFGVRGSKINQNYYPPEDEVYTWLSSACISVNLQSMTSVVFMNDLASQNGLITEFVVPTETFKINTDDRKNRQVVLNDLAIYPYPMTEAQMRALVQQ